ncbi:MAG: efflux RND transporter periplasmic adaptor subunit [candidate division KSB1 bacterium]|nr:efflux RND transporter periplasmic adaptor subunit [candidate division KSB1 bacterium]
MKRIFLVTAVFISFWLIHGCGSKPESPAEAKKSNAKLVKVQTVQTRKLTEKLKLPGTLRAENVANILATAEGKISKLLVREGDRVQSNQVVAMLSSLVREDIINSARLLVQAKQEALTKEPNNSELQRELEQAQADYQFALQQYKEIPVTSPIAGVVSQRRVDLGDMVPAKTKLFEIQSSARLLADVPVSELDIRKLKTGQTAEILADACPEKRFHGVIQRIYPQVNSQTRNGIVEIKLKNPCSNLRAGMFVRVLFVTQTLENALAIPVRAIIERPQHKTCFVVRNGKAEEKILQTGLQTDGWLEILSGVAPGDKIVIEGQQQLKTGTVVKIQVNK